MLIGLSALVLAAFAVPANAASSATVAVNEGQLRGDRVGAVIAFMGVPYAAPPVGANRWRAPQPLPKWQGARDARRAGASCMQPAQYDSFG